MRPKPKVKSNPRPTEKIAFPWRCRQCGKHEVEMAASEYEAHVRHDGRLHTFSIPALKAPQCRACGARVITEEVDTQVNDALRAHLNLLSPSEIRSAIDGLGISQKALANSLGIAQETLSRWLNDSQIQSRAMDTLLRIYFKFSQVRADLGAGAR